MIHLGLGFIPFDSVVLASPTSLHRLAIRASSSLQHAESGLAESQCFGYHWFRLVVVVVVVVVEP